MVNNEERRTLSIDEVANQLGICRNLAYTLARNRELPGVIHLGQKRMVCSKVAIEQLLNNDNWLYKLLKKRVR